MALTDSAHCDNLSLTFNAVPKRCSRRTDPDRHSARGLAAEYLDLAPFGRTTPILATGVTRRMRWNGTTSGMCASFACATGRRRRPMRRSNTGSGIGRIRRRECPPWKIPWTTSGRASGLLRKAPGSAGARSASTRSSRSPKAKILWRRICQARAIAERSKSVWSRVPMRRRCLPCRFSRRPGRRRSACGWNLDAGKTNVAWTGSVEVFNGFLRSAQPWGFQSGDTFESPSHWRLRTGSQPKGLTLDLTAADPAPPGSQDVTIVTIKASGCHHAG